MSSCPENRPHPLDSITRKLLKVAATAVVWYFISFTVLCWLLDFFTPAKLQAQAQYALFFNAGVYAGSLALCCSIALRRQHRQLARIGLYTCLLGAVWAALPRL